MHTGSSRDNLHTRLAMLLFCVNTRKISLIYCLLNLPRELLAMMQTNTADDESANDGRPVVA